MTSNRITAQGHTLPRSDHRLSDLLQMWQGVKDRASVATTELCWDTFFKGEQIGEQGCQR